MKRIHGAGVPRALAVAGLCAALFSPATVLAHERRTIGGGKYDVNVGWDIEPAYVGLKNSAGIRILDATTQNPVEGADKALRVQIRQGASTRELPLHADFGQSGQSGYYVADFIPTRDGDYRWTFTGTINGDQVNETFDTADGKIDTVQPQAALQFPVTFPDPGQSAVAIQAAQADAQSARLLAYAGIGIGILGLLVGAGAWLIHSRAPGAAAASQPARERI
jgi:hypothetical protein